MKNIEIILVDIEGTTTNISFVKDVLFPYAKVNCKSFLSQHFDDPEIKSIVNDLIQLAIRDEKPIEENTDKEKFIDSIVANVHWQISEDHKTKELKNLQGKIWKVAFEDGSIKGHLYEDVPRNFLKWIEEGRKLFIYSSGSIEAQKLLFGNSEYGDMSNLITGHFDTNVGHKQESQSYMKIAKEINIESNKILFLSDIPGEVKAAQKVGMNVILIDRPNNPTDLEENVKREIKIVKNFDEICLQGINE